MFRSWRRRDTIPLFAAFLLVIPRSASAQTATASPDDETPVTSPAPSKSGAAIRVPELVQSVEATYPEGAKAERREASVLLRLTIDDAGAVTEAEVVEGAGHGFDEAARTAAMSFRFKPAERDGTPIAARIMYRCDFWLPPDPQPPASAPLLGTDEVSEVAVASPAAETLRAGLPAALDSNETEPVSVTVVGQQSEAERLQQSAEAVNVVDIRRAKQQSADLGEVLARTQGVAIRRDGGLGSNARFSLNGLYDDQIRFFLDGVPLELAGYPFGIANVPVNLIDRVEVYRGVVPIRFGADALGGAVNLIGSENYDTHTAASYQVGSFGTHRVSMEERYHHVPTGVVIGGAGFFDVTPNNYRVDVEVPDALGRMRPATVTRFHDAYLAYGATLEAGVLEQPWAKRLLVRGFYSGYDKELQNNLVMKVPYGEVTYGETVFGATARYDVDLLPGVELETIASYAHRAIDFSDQSEWLYDWYGRRIQARRVPGEIEAVAHDQTVWQDSVFGRGLIKWQVAPAHVLRASVSPAFASRTGDERIQTNPEARDELTALSDLFTLVSGIEYELNALSERFSNVLFVKDYYYDADLEEPLPGDIFRKRQTTWHRQGIGDSLRFRFTPWLYAKASYEYATRLPRPDEVFGNGIRIKANLEIVPETSHNANLGPRVELRRTSAGDFTLDVNVFLRESENLVVLLLGDDRNYTYQNVHQARGFGVENAVNWSSPGRYLNLDGMLTWQSVRNISNQGTFGDSQGDRIPNRPYLFGSWGARLRFAGTPGPTDTVEPFYNGRYVHGFFRGWESKGLKQFKQTVDQQTTHNVGVSWTVTRSATRIVSTFEIDNVSNAKAYDNFGVQRPGRAYYVKVTGDLY